MPGSSQQIRLTIPATSAHRTLVGGTDRSRVSGSAVITWDRAAATETTSLSLRRIELMWRTVQLIVMVLIVILILIMILIQTVALLLRIEPFSRFSLSPNSKPTAHQRASL